jgi:hypothetical protein
MSHGKPRFATARSSRGMRRSRVPRAGLFPGCGFPAFPPRAVLPARGAEKANRGFGLSALGPKASGSQTHGGASIKRESCSIGRPANPSGKAARSNSGSGDHRGMKSSPGEDLGERSRASAELSCDPRSRAKRAATVEKHREIFPRRTARSGGAAKAERVPRTAGVCPAPRSACPAPRSARVRVRFVSLMRKSARVWRRLLGTAAG